MFQIYIKTLQGKTITLNVEAWHTVHYVKGLIEHSEGIPPNCQRLIYAGKQMDDSHTLQEYNIAKQSCIHLAMRMLGGVCINLKYW